MKTVLCFMDLQFVQLLQRLYGTYLFFPLSACILCWDQGFVVGTALCCKVDLGQSIFYQRHWQVHTLNVQPANEVPCFVHALHFNFHLEQMNRREEEKRLVNVLYPRLHFRLHYSNEVKGFLWGDTALLKQTSNKIEINGHLWALYWLGGIHTETLFHSSVVDFPVSCLCSCSPT